MNVATLTYRHGRPEERKKKPLFNRRDRKERQELFEFSAISAVLPGKTSCFFTASKGLHYGDA